MKGENSQNVTIRNEVKGRGLFYGVIAVATFIIMAVGTTFAYFTATTNSADTSVQTGSTTLRLQYIGYEGAWMNADLIPADTKVVEYSFEYQSDATLNEKEEDYETMRYNALCKDDYGNSICSVYMFQVKNDANSPQSVSLNVVTTKNEFGSLRAMAYEITAPLDEESSEYKHYNNKEQEVPVLGEDGEQVPETDEETGEPVLGEDGLPVGKTELKVVYPNNGLSDPTFKQTEEDKTEGAFDVRDGDGNFLTPDKYTAVYVNRYGVTKTLLKYVDDESNVQPAIDREIKIIDPAEPEKNSAKIADNITIDGKSTKTFALVLYIKNKEEDQTETDADKEFSGQVVVSSGDGKVGVSGSISVEGAQELQSGATLGGNA